MVTDDEKARYRPKITLVGLFLTAIALLVVLSPFYWYFSNFRVSGLDRPPTYVKGETPAQLLEFRRMAVVQVIDPTTLALQELQRLHLETKNGTASSTDQFAFSELGRELSHLKSMALLLRIPHEYRQPYERVRHGTEMATLSVCVLEDSLNASTQIERQQLYSESAKYAKRATRDLIAARKFFSENTKRPDRDEQLVRE